MNKELEEKHSMIQWAHRSWPQHITGFVYMDHLCFSYYLLDLLQTGFCSQYSIKNTALNVINSVLNLLHFSEAAFVSIDQCPFLKQCLILSRIQTLLIPLLSPWPLHLFHLCWTLCVESLRTLLYFFSIYTYFLK